MAEYITREAALMAVCRAELPDKTEDGTPILNGKRKVSDCVRRIKAIPAADVIARKHGKWIGGELGRCSCCGNEGCFSDIWPDGQVRYCPYCGADLRGEGDV